MIQISPLFNISSQHTQIVIYWMKGRITKKNSPTETIDNTTVINRSRLTSDMLIILLSLHYIVQLIDLIFYSSLSPC